MVTVVGTEVALVGVPIIGVTESPACAVINVPVIPACRVDGVNVMPPPAATVCAAAVCLANSSIIAIGFSTEGKGETNNPVGIRVGVAAGACDNDCVQALTKTVMPINVIIAGRPRFLILICSPLSRIQEDGSTSRLKRQAAQWMRRPSVRRFSQSNVDGQ